MQETTYWNVYFLLPVLGGLVLTLPFGHQIRQERKNSRKKKETGEERKIGEGWYGGRGQNKTDYRTEQEIKEKAGDLLAQLWLYDPMSQNAYSVTWYLTGKGKKGVS